MLEKRAESPASGARFVRLCFVEPDSLTVKDLPAKRLTKLLHETLTLATTKKHKPIKDESGETEKQ